MATENPPTTIPLMMHTRQAEAGRDGFPLHGSRRIDGNATTVCSVADPQVTQCVKSIGLYYKATDTAAADIPTDLPGRLPSEIHTDVPLPDHR